MTTSFSQRSTDVIRRQRHGYQVVPTNASFVSLLEPSLEDPVYWKIRDMTGDLVGYDWQKKIAFL